MYNIFDKSQHAKVDAIDTQVILVRCCSSRESCHQFSIYSQGNLIPVVAMNPVILY